MYSNFAKFHPTVTFMYFIIVIAFSMFVNHPVFLITSLICGFIYSIIIGKKTVKFNICVILPMAISSVIINILFNKNGSTVIHTLPWGRDITYETLIAGIATASVIASVICWVSCYNIIITNDKFIYIFGRRIPSLSLILSMVFRFIPQFKVQFKKTVIAQKCIGNDITRGNLIIRIKNFSKIMIVMIGWALENSVETADSMKSRGYSLKNKTTFNIYKFNIYDFILAILILIITIYILFNIVKGKVFCTYYPIFTMKTDSYLVFSAFLLLCILPIIIEIQGILKWKYYLSKI